MSKESLIIPEDHDYRSHHHDWLSACVIAKENSATENDRDYWQHQIETLNRIDEECKSLTEKANRRGKDEQ